MTDQGLVRFDTDAAFWADWHRNWLLYGTVYAINNPEPRVVPAETLTVHEGPCRRCLLPLGPDGQTVTDVIRQYADQVEWPYDSAVPLRDWADAIDALLAEQSA